MKKLLASLLFMASAAIAGPLAPLTASQSQAIVAHCHCVMDGGVCTLETRRPLVSHPVQYGARSIQPADENFLTLAGPAMCEVAKQELDKDSTSDRAFVIRQRWRQDFRVCQYPAVRGR